MENEKQENNRSDTSEKPSVQASNKINTQLENNQDNQEIKSAS